MALSKIELFDVDMLEQLLRHDGITKDVKDGLRKYKKRRANGNQVAIMYDYGKGIRDLKKGRLYPQPHLGLSAFPSDVRAALAMKYYDEIDMENSQPVLLNQIAEKEKVDHSALDEFVLHRKQILQELQEKDNMTRDEAKSVCFKVFYGFYTGSHPLFAQMRKELETLANVIMERYPEFVEVARKSKEEKHRNPSDHSNIQGSTLAHYAQHLETKLLLLVDEFLSSKGYQLDVLQHDGGDVRKKDGESVPLSLLQEAQEVLFEQTGFRVHLTIKPLKHTFQFAAREPNLIPTNIPITDSWAAEQFVKVAGDRIRRVGTELYVLNSSDMWESGEFALRMLIEEYEDKLRWKQYNQLGMMIHYDYGSTVNNISRLITQTKVKAKEGSLPIQFAFPHAEPHEDSLAVLNRFNHLLRIVSGNNEILASYLLKWVAHILQKPYELPGVSIILTGDKGIGKDTFFDFIIQYVLGKYSATNYDSNQQFFEKHDTGRKGKLLVKLEEANRKLCMENKDKLKSMLTASESTFNPKNEKPITLPNLCRFVFTTNKGNPVDFGEGERRFVIFPCSSEMKGNQEWFSETRELLFNAEAGRTIGDFLQKIDLHGFQIRKLPQNEYQEQVIETEASSEERFIEQWDGEPLSAGELFDSYRKYCQENDLPYAANAISFGQRLLPFLRDNKIQKKRKNTGVVYVK
jgi:hypothetical protein